MIHTMNKPKMTTTNLRLPTSDLLDYRAMAAELDLSFNEFAKKALTHFSHSIIFNDSIKSPKKDKPSLLNLAGIISSKKKQGLGLSKEDEEIYGN